MADWAFLAMASMKLGRESESLKYLTKFRRVYAAGDQRHQMRYKNLADEAESLVGTKPETPANPADTKPIGGARESKEPSIGRSP